MARRKVKKSRAKFGDLDIISATDTKKQFGELLHRVAYDRVPVLVERNGHPVAVLIDYQQYLELNKKSRSGGKKRPRRGRTRTSGARGIFLAAAISGHPRSPGRGDFRHSYHCGCEDPM